MYVNQE